MSCINFNLPEIKEGLSTLSKTHSVPFEVLKGYASLMRPDIETQELLNAVEYLVKEDFHFGIEKEKLRKSIEDAYQMLVVVGQKSELEFYRYLIDTAKMSESDLYSVGVIPYIDSSNTFRMYIAKNIYVSSSLPGVLNRNMADKVVAPFEDSEKLLEYVKKQSNKFVRFDEATHKYYIKINGIEYEAEASASQIASNFAEFTGSKNLSTVSSHIGIQVDTVVREYFQALLKNPTLKTEEAIELLEGNADLTKAQIEQIVKDLEELRGSLDATFGKGDYKVFSEEVPLFSLYRNLQMGEEAKDTLIGGTMDLIVYTRDGQFHIVDIKTVRNSDKKDLSKYKEKWSRQISLYNEMIKQVNPRLAGKMGTPKVLHFNVNYPTYEGETLKKEEVPRKDGKGTFVRYVDSSGESITGTGVTINLKSHGEGTLLDVGYNPSFASSIAPAKEILNSLIANKHSKPITSEEERILGNSVAYSFSELLNMIQKGGPILEYIANGVYSKTDFSKMSRTQVINTIGVDTLMDIIRENIIESLKARLNSSDPKVVKEVGEQIKYVRENFHRIVEAGHLKYRNLEGIKISLTRAENVSVETVEEEEEVNEEKEKENWMYKTGATSVTDSLSYRIRFLFEGIVNEEETSNSRFGLPIFEDSDELYGHVLSWVHQASSYSEMKEIMERMEYHYPWVRELINQLEESPDLQSEFFYGIRNDFLYLSSIYENKGIMVNAIANSSSRYSNLKSQAIEDASNGKMSFLNKDTAVEDTHGNLIYTVNRQRAKEILDALMDIDLSKVKFRMSLQAARSLDFSIPLAKAMQDLGIDVDSHTIERMAVLSPNRTKDMLKELRELANYIYQTEEGVHIGPMSYTAEHSFYSRYASIMKKIDNALGNEQDSSVYVDGNNYYSYRTPSYLSTIIKQIRGPEGLKVMEQEWGQYDYYKSGKTYLTPLLQSLQRSESKRAAFDVKQQLTFMGVPYERLSAFQYRHSLMAEFFAKSFVTDGIGLTYHALPVIANKHTSEFIFAERFGDDNRQVMVDGFFSMFKQELMRIKSTLERARIYKGNDQTIANLDISSKVVSSKEYIEFEKNAQENGYSIIDILNTPALSKSGAFLKTFSDLIEGILAVDEEGNPLNKELIEFIDTYLNGEGFSETIELQDKAKEIFMALMDEKFQKEVDEVIKDLIDNDLYIREVKDEKTDKVVVYEIKITQEAMDPKRLAKLGYPDIHALMRKELYNYVSNKKYYYMNFVAMFAGDIAYYASSEDLNKRLAQIHSPGRIVNTEATVSAETANEFMKEGTRYSDGIHRAIYINDDIVSSEAVDDIMAIHEAKLATIEDPEEKAKYQEIMEKIKEGLKDINSTDGQAYTSPTGMMKKLAMMGLWTARHSEAYERIKKGKHTTEDLGVVMQPLKPFLYGAYTVEDQNATVLQKLKVNAQHKNSEYMLFVASALLNSGEEGEDFKLKGLYEFLENGGGSAFTSGGTYTGKGIDTVTFVSGVKTGISGIIDITQATSSQEVIEILEKHAGMKEDGYDTTYVKELPFSAWRNQMPVPEKGTDHEQLFGTQPRGLITSGYNPQGKLIDRSTDKETTYQELIEEYKALIHELVNRNTQELKERLNMLDDYSGDGLALALSEILQHSVKHDSKFNPDLLEAVKIDPLTGEFNIPLSDPIMSKKVQNLINAELKKAINKVKVRGGSAVQVSTFGIQNKPKIVFERDSEGKAIGVKHVEAYIPIHDSKLEKALTKEDGTMMSVKEALEAGIITEDMLTAIGYRIPTENKYSMLPIKVIGFVPKLSGETAILPDETVFLMGSDFDIDKLYLFLKNPKATYTVHQKQAIEFLKEKFPNMDKATIKSFVKAKVNNTEIENTKENKRLNVIWKRSMKKFTSVSFSSENDTDTKKGMTNRILDIMFSLATSPENSLQLLKPGNFDTIKSSGYVLELISKGYSLEEIKDKTNKQLKELLGDVNFFSEATQVKFQNLNAVAGTLVGIFANHNIAHAFLQQQNLTLGRGIKFTFNNVQIGKGSRVDAVFGHDGMRILDRISEFIAASVDATKDPVLSLMGIDLNTVNVGIFLIRLGFSIQEVAAFLRTPEVQSISNWMSTNNTTRLQKLHEAIKDIKVSEFQGFDTEFFMERIASGKFESLEIAALFFHLNGHAEMLTDINYMTKFNSASNANGPTIVDNIKARLRVEKARGYFTQGYFDNAGEDVIDSDPILSAFFENTHGDNSVANSIFQRFFIEGSSDFVRIFKSVLGTEVVSTKNINHMASHLMVYAAARSGLIPTDKEAIRDLIFGRYITDNGEIVETGLPSRLRKVRGEVSTKNFFLNNFIIKTDSRGRTYLEFKRFKASSNRAQKMRDAWEDLYNSNNPEHVQLAKDLFIAGILMKGFSYSPSSWLFIAPAIIKKESELYLDTYREPFTPTEDDIIRFRDQYIANNTKRKGLIPPVPNSKLLFVEFDDNGLMRLRVDYQNTTANVQNFVTRDYKTPALYVEHNRQVYKLVYADPTGITATYAPMTHLGGSGLEYNAFEDITESAFTSNAFKASSIDMITETVEGEFDAEGNPLEEKYLGNKEVYDLLRQEEELKGRRLYGILNSNVDVIESLESAILQATALDPNLKLPILKEKLKELKEKNNLC